MNILTFDLEDWFHILDFKDTAHPSQWGNFESRVERNSERILELLEKHNLQATFFCLGWIAEKYPQLVRRIAKNHELACHSMDHQLLFSQSREDFKADLHKCVSILEALSGKKIDAYRAPGFSISNEHSFVFEELNREGISIDCSVFPAKRNHGGIADFPYQKPCKVIGDSFEVVEFPINTVPFLTKQIVFSGGGYFRLLPYSFVKNWMTKSDYVMTYFHPRDFDPDQPKLKGLSLKRKFMSYVGLNSSLEKLDNLLTDFDFVSLKKAYSQLDINHLPIVKF